MEKFPNPIPLPDSIKRARNKRSRDLSAAIRFGILIRLLIVGAEIAGFLLYNSSALLLDALATLMDIASTGLLFFCIKLAERPPDWNHPFGHGRYEPLAGLQMGLLLIVVGIALFIQQGYELATHVYTSPLDSRAWLIPLIAIILLEISYQYVRRKAKRTHSPALAADAIHYRVDAINSLLAMIALLLGAFMPSWGYFFDHLGAISITLLMGILGFFAARENFHQLMDRVPEKKFFEKVKKAACRVEGVLEIEKLRIQLFGPDAHVDIDIEVDPKLTVDIAHQISQTVRAEIQKDWPAVRDVTVHLEPFYPNDH